MMINTLPPAFILILGACLVPFLKGKIKSVFLLALPVLVFIILINLKPGNMWEVDFWGYKLILGRVDKLSCIFSYIFTIMAFIGVVFALNVKDNLQHVSGLIYIGSALGVVLAGDFLSLYLFWEIMSVSSTFLILASRTKESRKAGFRYFLVHMIGGLFLLAGIVLYIQKTGTLAFEYIGLSGIESYLIFIGIALNTAIIPLHAWLPDAYPMSTPAGTVFLSAFTTKSAVYLLVRTFPGEPVLMVIGAFMTALPIFYAVLENDMRRVLSYSLMNQVGFMLVGIGIGTNLSINGAVAHAFTDILFKGLLFMSMGAVLFRTGKMNATDLGGLYKTMPLTALFCCIGAASISAFPLFSGFVSKSMIVSASAHEKFFLLWLVLQFASTGVVDHAGIKVPFFTFFGHDSGIRTKEAPVNMLVAMGIAAAFCVGIGVYFRPLYDLLPFPVYYEPYTGAHVVTQLQLLLFGAFAFTLLLLAGLYVPEVKARNLDFDWTYRMSGRLIYRILDLGLNSLNRICESGLMGMVKLLSTLLSSAAIHLALFFFVNLWLIQGCRGQRLEIKKRRLYYDMSHGTFPVGITAAVSISFVILIFFFSRG